VTCEHRGLENILDAEELSDGFLARRTNHLVGSSLSYDLSAVQHDDLISKREHLVLRMGHEHNRHSMSLVPAANIIQYLGFRLCVEPAERLIQQEDAGICHQRAGECDPLTLTT